MQTPKTQTDNRAAFTLVEILVVITIIAVLAGIFTVVIGNAMNFAREKQTRSTIQKVDAIIKDRLRAFELDKDRTIAADIARLSSQDSLATTEFLTVYATKKTLWKYFGIDLLRDPPAEEVDTYQAKKAYSAELMYDLLTTGKMYDRVTGANKVPVPQMNAGTSFLELSSSEIGDTDGDGKNEIIDAWGEPLRFYLWPTRVIKPDGTNLQSPSHPTIRLLIPSMADTSDTILTKDPGDPTDVLNGSGYSSSFTTFVNGSDDYPALTTAGLHDPNTYHSFLIVSSGQDTTLGLFEPATGSGDTAEWSLGMPLNETAAGPIGTNGTDYNENGSTDTIDTAAAADDATHPYNSYMNDDLTNLQGTGGT